ncbi:MAG TPA: choice-of-anchor D domain-containing protein [Methylibium sp.]|nr:choice-of-anchor D domain-containing protein [Methylibium sp.]
MTVTLLRALWLACGLLACAVAQADALRGRLIYRELPGTDGSPGSCISCHGPNPTDNVSGILIAANNPEPIFRAIQANTGGMGYLGGYLDTTALIDLALYLGSPAVSGPLFTATPSQLAFTARVGDAAAAQTLTLRNRGTTPLTLVSLAITGAQAAEFSIVAGATCAAGLALAPEAGCALGLRFAPLASGARAAALEVAHDGADSPGRIALNGTAEPAGAGRLVVRPAALDFGESEVGSSAELDLRLSNGGSAALRVDTLLLTGPYALAAGDCGAVPIDLPVGASCSLALRFAPRALGALPGSLMLAGNDAAPTTVALDGRGIDSRAGPSNAGGGGCTLARPGAPFDPVLALLALAAAAVLWRRRR